MEKFNPFDKIIESKLTGLPEDDTHLLWQDMKAILDRKMPQQKRRPVLWEWSFLELSALLVGSVSLLVLGSSVLGTVKTETAVASPLKQTAGKSNDAAPVTAFPKGATTAVILGRSTSPVVDNGVRTTNTPRIAAAIEGTAGRPQEPVAYLPVTIARTAHRQSVAVLQDPAIADSKMLLQQEEASAGTTVLLNDHKGAAALAPSLGSPGLLTPSSELSSVDPGVAANRVHLRGSVIDPATFDSLLALQKKMHARNRQTGPYAAVMAGLDLSSVQFRSLQPGVNKGILAGYAFSKRWSVESGLYWNKKSFRGRGDDIHPEGYTLPAGVTLLSVQARNSLYEWPLNIRYAILPHEHKLFVTAGLSSYFIKNESYDYSYEYNGQYGSSYSGFDNQTKNWFSVASIGLGYSHRLGAIGSVRVEPYLKLPLKNIGVNRMPVVSTGLNIGFTRGILK